MKLQFLVLEPDIYFNLTLALCDFTPGVKKPMISYYSPVVDI